MALGRSKFGVCLIFALLAMPSHAEKIRMSIVPDRSISSKTPTPKVTATQIKRAVLDTIRSSRELAAMRELLNRIFESLSPEEKIELRTMQANYLKAKATLKADNEESEKLGAWLMLPPKALVSQIPEKKKQYGQLQLAIPELDYQVVKAEKARWDFFDRQLPRHGYKKEIAIWEHVANSLPKKVSLLLTDTELCLKVIPETDEFGRRLGWVEVDFKKVLPTTADTSSGTLLVVMPDGRNLVEYNKELFLSVELRAPILSGNEYRLGVSEGVVREMELNRSSRWLSIAMPSTVVDWHDLGEALFPGRTGGGLSTGDISAETYNKALRVPASAAPKPSQ